MPINPVLVRQARQALLGIDKHAFVAAGDPAMGADPAAGGGDPAAGGMPPGGDPAAAGGTPPAGGDPSGGAGGGQDMMSMIQPMIQQAVQQAMQSSGGGGGAGAGTGPGLKPKIDINVEIMQMKKLLAKLCDTMGVQIPASDMVATPADLNQMAASQGNGGGAAAGGGQQGGALGQIQPVQPMKAALDEWEAGEAFTPPSEGSLKSAHAQTRSNSNMAVAMLLQRQQRKGG